VQHPTENKDMDVDPVSGTPHDGEGEGEGKSDGPNVACFFVLFCRVSPLSTECHEEKV
jgi:hypothetical protein